MVCGMPVYVSLSINVCMSTVSNAPLMSSATAMVRVGGMGRLKPVATAPLMSCCACGVPGLEPVLCCDARHVLCDVRKNHLLECPCDHRQKGHRPA